MSTLAIFLKNHFKIVLVIILLLAIAAAVLYQTGLIGKSEVSYKTKQVVREDLATVINASGVVEAENQANLSFLTGGRVVYAPFKEGDLVKKGQVIASLDSSQAKDAVSKAEAVYASAQSTITKVLDDIRLIQYGNMNNGETMTQKNNREIAEMSRDAAYQDLQSAKKNLEWTTIIAPFDGVISEISGISVGTNISATSPGKITVLGSGDLKFVANVDEIDYYLLKIGDQGEILLDAFPEQTINGQIFKIGVSAVKLATGGSVVPIELAIPWDNRLKSGLNGEVNFTVVSKKEVITLPRSAIKKDNGNSYVNLLVDKKPLKVVIKTGETLGNQTEVTEGLGVGDLVILGDVNK